jgi:DNA-binding XRE family transcriptional regulator
MKVSTEKSTESTRDHGWNGGLLLNDSTEILDLSQAKRPRNANLIGRKVARLRNQQRLSQNMLVARLEVMNYFEITRDILASIELQRYAATDKHAFYLAKALRVPLTDLFAP